MNISNFIVFLILHDVFEVLLIQSSSNRFEVDTEYHRDIIALKICPSLLVSHISVFIKLMNSVKCQIQSLKKNNYIK